MWNNRITELLKIRYPFVQAPMLGFTTPEMVAAASNEGWMGSLPLGLMSKEEAGELITKTKQLSHAPFGVNIFSYSPLPVGPDRSANFLKSYYARNGVGFPDLPAGEPYPSYEALLDLIIGEKIPAVSFTFGIPSTAFISELKKNHTVLMGVATCSQEAKLLQKAGMDVVIAQGIEAGGHRGSFIEGKIPAVGLVSLLPQIIDSVSIPVIAAGGLSEGRSIAAAFVLGAEGVQVGSAFLRSHESAASQVHKDILPTLDDRSTEITNAWTGRFARMVSNRFMEEIPPGEILHYPYQNYMTSFLRRFGKLKERAEIQTLYAGQSAKYALGESVADIIKNLTSETEKVLESAGMIYRGPGAC